MIEPKRNGSWERLKEPFRTKIHLLFDAMRDRGQDPVILEGLRTAERQRWLYGIGRTHHLNQRPVTWTLKSEHLKGLAADVVSRKWLFNNPGFYRIMRQEAAKLGLYTLYPREDNHVQLRKP